MGNYERMKLSYLCIAFSRRAVVSYWRKYVHEVLVNRLGGLSLSRKSVVRLTDRPDMTLDVYPGRKTTIQQIKAEYSNVGCVWGTRDLQSDFCRQELWFTLIDTVVSHAGGSGERN